MEKIEFYYLKCNECLEIGQEAENRLMIPLDDICSVQEFPYQAPSFSDN